MAKTAIGNTAPTLPVLPANQERRFLYLENPSAVDYRFDFVPGVTMTGSTTGMLLKAGERLMLTADNFGFVGGAFYFIATSGTPDLIHVEKSA